MNSYTYIRNIFLFFCMGACFSSCFGSKPIAYFSAGGIDTSKIQNINIPEQVIQKGDLLSISIFSDNPDATAIFNQAGGVSSPVTSSLGVTKSLNSSVSGSTANSNSGYLVDGFGEIYLHAMGRIKAEGLSRSQLKGVIVSKLDSLAVLSNPYVVIRFSNLKITLLGEVRSPGVFTLPSEKASILEAVGLAGDITDYGQKDKVLVIREDQGKRTYHRINLLDPNVFASPYFYLRQNDVVLVEADSRKPTALDQQTMQYIMLAASLASTAAIIITLFK